ncbi:FAD-dependent oxidoreductase [Pseudonocardia hispaniensis]|uniref:FAD-dependent oxidoreductase n=1 Tax=Pseudonocardia hispaniensis TaxID=904933 RepID=A0ABW1J5N2_9PSEU
MIRYPNLFSPLDIGPVRVRNRIMQTCHSKLYARDGADSQRTIDYYVERARGGAGLLTVDARNVDPTSLSGFSRGYNVGYDPRGRVIERLLTQQVHDHGAAVFTQISHFGLNSASDAADDLRVLLGPSAVKSPVHGEMPKVMEIEDIHAVVDAFARTAEACRDGGFDGIEIHLAHSYLLHQFLSPLYNKRPDDYGGSWENRTRFAHEVIAAVRRRTGHDWTVGVRISLSDFIDGALDISDAIRLGRDLRERGGVDFLCTTGACYHNLSKAAEPSDAPDGYLADLAAQLKRGVPGIPIFAVGGIKDPVDAEQLIATGQADMVAMTRALLADPELPNKAAAGREDEIVHCIRGNQGCMARVVRSLPAGCTVNPAAGREGRLGAGTLVAARQPERWLVVGGGPAGMRAAATLARREHRVTLAEREPELGGQVRLILKTPGRETFAYLIDDLVGQLRTLGVTVETNRAVTAEDVTAAGFDNVIVATGATPARTGFSSVNPLVDQLPGVGQDNVLTVWDVLRGTRPIGQRVVVLDDEGTRYAAGVTEVLLDRGHDVELITPMHALWPGTVGTQDMATLYGRLLGKGLRHRLNSWALAIDGDRVDVVHLYMRAVEQLTGVDTVVLAMSRQADDALYHALKGRVRTLHRIGDCLAPRKLDHAIYEGELAGRELWDPADRFIHEGDLELLRTTGVAAG